MKILSRQDILSKRSLGPQQVDVPEWGGTVQFKPMTMVERREIRQKCMTTTIDEKTGEKITGVDQEKLEIMVIICCALQPDGKVLFGLEDIAALEEEMSAGPISTLAQAILRASGFIPDAVDKSNSKAKS